MSIIDRILGRTPSPGTPITASPRGAKPVEAAPSVAGGAVPAPSKPAGEEMIRVYDQFGRKMEVGRESWRKDVLLPNLAANRDKPEALFGLIVNALNDDFAPDVLESARHLAAQDPQPPRGAALLGAVLLQIKDYPAARDVLERALAKHGNDVYLLANLARACAALGDEERAQKLIWLALSLDPNEESSLGFLISLANARGGIPGVMDIYTRAAALPGSWRAQIWLARYALERGDLAGATRFYEEALGRASPVPADLLMQMSGDLGNRGQTQLLVQLTQPRFDPLAHGLMVGNNLLRAYLELGMFAEARKILEQLYAQQRPDWREHLMFWEQKLDEAAKRYGEVTGPLEVMFVKLLEPVWAHGVRGFDGLWPAKSAADPLVYFVAGSGESAVGTDKVVSQPTDALGRISRSLPLFLAEELHVRTRARTAYLLPWMKAGGFALSVRPWTREFLSTVESQPGTFVFLHVDARTTPWTLEMRVESHAGGEPQVFRQTFGFDTAAQDVLALATQVLGSLTAGLGLRVETATALPPPPASLLPNYLVALEQALAVALAARMEMGSGFLHQERSIFDHLFEVALHAPALLRARLLLVNALENEQRQRRDIAAEYLGKLALLQERHPLPAGQGRELVAEAIERLRGKSRHDA